MLDAILTRRSVRRFEERRVEAEKLLEILKAAFFAPTAKNLRLCEFIVVQNIQMIEHLSLATPYSSFAKDAPLIIVICYNEGKGRRFREDCAIASENIYLEATNQGLGTCYVQICDGTEADAGDPETYVKNLLGIPAGVRVLCLMPVGYPAAVPTPHTDAEYDTERVHMELYGS
ncbi:MAG TPA: nitroreductase family protein [Dissulfurispiraceae bacterium]|nr:nitroreductase family protein [Dissulfurispiraceae bacterium]